MKRILVLNGNPKEQSLCRALAESYAQGARDAGCHLDVIHLSDYKFDPVLKSGYESKQSLEDSLQNIKEKIQQSDHVVIVYPVWWGSVPAGLKGMLDRIFLPGFAFKYEKGDLLPQRLLKGRTARIIVTMDTPIWYYKLIYGAPATKMMKKTVLEFCGFNPVKVTEFGAVLNSSESQRQKWLAKVNKQGAMAI
ncbi:NAD(P)H-dependent oxidoreductase [Photobacterium sp.]|uniref:NAD(P)H-dependent oxidoreductase n=1 Tax=Photobacterium sp. TaxID=660 RepID=UPI00299F45DE|nr:NAD(P)H-dependent oxidoreductase [Photobacterium sp.]MDX1302773.1 NAD(P)H-dependent oxidoreductase [Photobacterium sp.]